MSFRDIIARDLEKVFYAGTGLDEPVTVRPRYGTEQTINAYIDRPYDEQYGVESYSVRMTCRTVDVKDLRRDDQVIVDGVVYRVKAGPQDDRYGESILFLTREVIHG